MFLTIPFPFINLVVIFLLFLPDKDPYELSFTSEPSVRVCVLGRGGKMTLEGSNEKKKQWHEAII